MKILLLLMTCFLIGCSSSGSSYKKVSVSSSEAAALSALSETLKIGSSEGQSEAGDQAPSSTGPKKVSVPGFTK
tara:strand:+ start:247 stop:468 length:222 start_codon:yes stop_codon:yes gene_type:complete